jgi:DNA-binding transcriptional LysR family regulator
VPIAPGSEAVLVASPAYLAQRSAPEQPNDLLGHRAVMCRSQATGLIMPWTLHRAGETVQISPPGAAVVHDLASQIDLAAKGLGIISAPIGMVSGLLDAGLLRRVLPAWSTPIGALYLYFPSRRHQSAALRAFVRFMTERRDKNEAAGASMVRPVRASPPLVAIAV